MSPRPQMAAQAAQISLAPNDSLTPKHQHGLRQQPRPLTSGWTLVATWATDISIDPGYSSPDPDHGLRWLHELFISTCPSLQYHLQYRLFPQCMNRSAVLSRPSLHHILHLSHHSISLLFAHYSGTCCGGQMGAWMSFFQSPQASGLGAAKFQYS